ncbi:(d)CMP kinase [Facklamia sp. DSM 111018]|uniref:Cytidylate kinase n=1 Tax=Facklamia lactis TaxID=2749967 RepID=A0ABS0LMY5_9LACT|nr:(d)CMP kinase [Facklamia lactis]MBG9979842.1 (d)CMP kinase [Facklamia lactis]MBG9985478.1 (d)CMP kinase [Facklamia lactis]
MLTIAIDGPAASGKSTVAKIIAQQLGIIYLDTGAMYRAITLACIQQEIDLNNDTFIHQVVKETQIDFTNTANGQMVLMNMQDVTAQIRSEEVNRFVSKVSAVPLVRKELVSRQQTIAHQHSVIMDGRDIGTVVLPNADYKFFLIASSRERAKRRYEENQTKGLTDQTLDEIEKDIIRRDQYDMNREISPLRKAKDAIEVDTSNMTINQVVKHLLSFIAKE